MAQSWTFDGEDLNTYAYNVRLLGAPLSIPARRGANVLVPGRTGRQHVDKRHDERTMSLAMFVRDIPPAGGSSSEAQLLANLDALRGLFARSGQRTLTHAMGGSSRSAQAEVISAVPFEPQGSANVYSFLVEFVLADPWWYAPSETVIGPTSITGTPQEISLSNGGTARAEAATFTIGGAITDPKLAIGSTYVQYTGTVAGGETLEIFCESWTALLDGEDESGNISHAGDLCWLPIPSGSSTLVVTGSSISGASVTVAFTAAYV